MAAKERKIRTAGVKCKICGCCHVPVRWTEHIRDTTVRHRECRNCGHRFKSCER